MNKLFHLFAIILFFKGSIICQKMPLGGGEMHLTINECLSENTRAAIIRENNENIRKLKLENTSDRMIVALDWPLRQATGYNDNGYYLISNYVDQNTASPAIQDYNCGNRTYDGHKGTDIAIWPFAWHKQKVKQVEIIAGQAGTIINKSDGNFDMNCSCTGTWNAVYIQHSDGSVVWYGHMKKGSLTTKAIGQTVAKGEYLGSVGSSGCSTGPHLHLEVYANSAQTTLIDPFGGTCNLLNGTTSWWTAQHPYLSPKLLDAMVHDCTSLSQPDGCPADVYTMCENYQINPGSTVAFSTHYRQQNNTLPTSFIIRRPDNTVWASWSFTPSSTSVYGSWWFWTYSLPSEGPFGNWKYEVTYNGDTVIKNFELIEKNSTRVGLGNLKPATQLQVSKGDVYLDNIGSGVVIKSPNGQCWRLTVDNSGVVVSTSIICPSND